VNDPGAADLTNPDRRGDRRQRNRGPAGRPEDQPPTLIGFHCPVCGYLRPAEEPPQVATPLCAGSKARTGQQHAPTPMQALLPPLSHRAPVSVGYSAEGAVLFALPLETVNRNADAPAAASPPVADLIAAIQRFTTSAGSSPCRYSNRPTRRHLGVYLKRVCG